MRHCACRHCGVTLVIGHPEKLLRERAEELAREASGVVQRVTGGTSRRAREIEARLIETFYAADDRRLRTLAPRCPRCHARDGHELPWWEPR